MHSRIVPFSLHNPNPTFLMEYIPAILDSLEVFKERGYFHLCPFCQEETMIENYEIYPFYRCPTGHPELKLFLPGRIDLRKQWEKWGFFYFYYYSIKEEFLELMEKERSGGFNLQRNAHYVCLDRL